MTCMNSLLFVWLVQQCLFNTLNCLQLILGQPVTFEGKLVSSMFLQRSVSGQNSKTYSRLNWLYKCVFTSETLAGFFFAGALGCGCSLQKLTVRTFLFWWTSELQKPRGLNLYVPNTDIVFWKYPLPPLERINNRFCLLFFSFSVSVLPRMLGQTPACQFNLFCESTEPDFRPLFQIIRACW